MAIDFSVQRYAFFALLAAALFGASTPFAKLLLGEMSPLVLAGLLYLGSGAGLAIFAAVRKYLLPSSVLSNKEARLSGMDYAWLGGAVLTGGVAAPILLLWGLSGTTAAGASLLLNLESVITTLVAALFFREFVARRVWLASVIMLLAGLMLAYDPNAAFGFSLKAFAVIGACFMWALDNNLTRNISASDPVAIAMLKGLVAGSVSLTLALIAGAPLPHLAAALGAATLGLFSYGISLVLFVYALRHLGSARTGAHFSTGPFFGAILAILLLGEPLSAGFLIALALMMWATYLVITEQHGHQHTHETLAHTHQHLHDEHHQHEHSDGEDAEPHSHPHVHQPITHHHPHMPDIHHRHDH